MLVWLDSEANRASLYNPKGFSSSTLNNVFNDLIVKWRSTFQKQTNFCAGLQVVYLNILLAFCTFLGWWK